MHLLFLYYLHLHAYLDTFLSFLSQILPLLFIITHFKNKKLSSNLVTFVLNVVIVANANFFVTFTAREIIVFRPFAIFNKCDIFSVFFLFFADYLVWTAQIMNMYGLLYHKAWFVASGISVKHDTRNSRTKYFTYWKVLISPNTYQKLI